MNRKRADVDAKEYGTRVLQIVPECKGTDVWELQIKLIGWGSGSDNDDIGSVMDPVRVTGTFDATTRDAVMRFQKAHGLPVNGIVDAQIFRALDREAAFHPVFVHDMKCPCIRGENDDPILCRCENHPPDEDGGTGTSKCTGFGKTRFKDKFLLDGRTLADGTALESRPQDLYDMYEYEGIDKVLLWAVRGLMHRANVKKVKVISGYRCWHDNYHHTDDTRWRHRRSTLHFGKAIEFYHDGECAEFGQNPDAAPCVECRKIRKDAREKCGFQLRWHEPDRVSVAEGEHGHLQDAYRYARPPTTPFAVYVDTVRLQSREDSDFVKSHEDGVKPLYEGKTPSVSFPLDLGSGLDPKSAISSEFFEKVEKQPEGRFPMGASRMWHGGIHLYPEGGKPDVYSMWDGEIVACRVGESEDAKPYGSRNFVTIKHKWKNNVFYSLFMHLDSEKVAANARSPWLRQLHIRSAKHVEATVPVPFLRKVGDEFLSYGGPGADKHEGAGLGPGDRAEVDGNEADARTVAAKAPENSKVIKLKEPNDAYVYTQIEGKSVATIHEANASLRAKIDSSQVISLKDPKDLIRVYAGELLGGATHAPTDAKLKDHGAHIHIETFAASPFVAEDYTIIDVNDANKVVDRKEVMEALKREKLLVPMPDDVLLDGDVRASGQDPNVNALRSVILKMPSAWALDWKLALAGASCFSFMKDQERDALGDRFNEYRWWSADSDLPNSNVVHHYNPFVLLLHIAYTPPG